MLLLNEPPKDILYQVSSYLEGSAWQLFRNQYFVYCQ